MIELLRNCVHGSEIAMYLARDEAGGKKIIKTTTSPDGIKTLRNEACGWAWYQRLRYPGGSEPICKIAQEKPSYIQIQIKFIDGEKAVCNSGVEKNQDALGKLVNHYCEIWPGTADSAPLHGDLSLDNVIVNSDGVHFIDWEHFSEAGVPWGFDALYSLYETLYFGMRERASPNAEEARIIKGELARLNSCRGLSAQILKSPLKFLTGFISKHAHLWGAQLESFRMKLPVLAFTPAQIAAIDDVIAI